MLLITGAFCMTTRMEDINGWVERLRNTEKLIIVEGVKDKRALEKLGARNVLVLNKPNTPLYKIIEAAAEESSNIIILTDLDKKGRQLYRMLKTELQGKGVRVDSYFREFLFRNTKLRQIEGLDSYYEVTVE